ncbi:hypothetical protein OHA71_23760 [Streptomyces sp. NBC_00444]|uniref:hypothetical protein n=1 Tax=Streptomyces sp. NBC_00444 TaxID=2975744 RepID=UPI002E237A5C
MDAGDLATWVGSTFAAIAAGATLWTLKSQRDQIGEQRTFIGEQRMFMVEQSATLALEREELRAVAEDRRWAQARQIRMYQRQVGARLDGAGQQVTPNDHWAVTVQNGSDAPVHQLEVRFGTAHLAAEVYEWPAFEPAQLRATVGDRLVMPVFLLGPRRALRFASQAWPETTVHNNRPTLFFTDDNGVRWSLDSQGKLEEVPAEPQA